jgi:hypothetical protein
MRIPHRYVWLLMPIMMIGACVLAMGQEPLDNHFNYQGQIKQNSAPYTGTCDLIFTLFPDSLVGSPIGTPFNAVAIAVAKGLFTAQLDLGPAAFNGSKRWLEIQARCPASSGSFATLSPRQELTAVPHAAFALQAGSAATAASMPWSGLSSVPAGLSLLGSLTC